MPADDDDDIGLKFLDFPVKKYEARHDEYYTFEAAISDLVDNSIDSGASFVEILIPEQDFDPKPKHYSPGLSGEENFFAMVIDDGKGIHPDEFLGAMSDGYEREYDETELGAFGVGLKASSLSQAYEVTVMSKIEGRKPRIGRLSSCLVKEHEKERLWQEEDLMPWMLESRGYNLAKKSLGELKHGTVVLLEGLHKLELEVGSKHKRSHYTGEIITRVKNYLGLVFHYYIDGTQIPRSDGTKQKQDVKLFFDGRKPVNNIHSIDPFGQRWYDGYDGDSKGTLCISKKFATLVNNEPRDVVANMWILPHPDARDGRIDMQNRMKTVRNNASIIGLQGVYIYRNMRLIDFSPAGNPWASMMKPQDHLVYSRAEIHLPPCRPRDKREFNINTSKTQVNLGEILKEELHAWAGKPGRKWNAKDPVMKTYKDRGILRNGNDSNWPKCKFCEENSIPGGDNHTFTKCPERPVCEFCNKKTHGTGIPLTREYCKKVQPCAKCSSKMHSTEEHSDSGPTPPPEPPPQPPEPPNPVPEPSPFSQFPKRYTDKGPLIESVDGKEDSLPTIKINRKHKHYDKLRDLMRD